MIARVSLTRVGNVEMTLQENNEEEGNAEHEQWSKYANNTKGVHYVRCVYDESVNGECFAIAKEL